MYTEHQYIYLPSDNSQGSKPLFQHCLREGWNHYLSMLTNKSLLSYKMDNLIDVPKTSLSQFQKAVVIILSTLIAVYL